MRKIRHFLIVGIIFCVAVVSGIDILQASSDITSSDFEIDVSAFTPWDNTDTLIDNDSAGGTVNNVLTTVLQKLILVFWACAVFIMTIGAWYMIIYHGQDEFLSKWKSIFMSGIIALAVALSAGFIVRLFALLLY